LLHTGYRDCSALDLARNLLTEFSDLGGVMRAGSASLLACTGVGTAKYAQLRAALELARRQALQALGSGDVLTSPAETRRFLQYHLGGHRREVFSCLFLDSQHRVLRCEDLFMGTLDGAAVYPREVAVPREWRNQAVPTGGSPSACAPPWRCWISGFSITSLSAAGESSHSPRRACCRVSGPFDPACYRGGVLV
jgi:hypothetical protein